jgi:prevent-host-death family protein
MTIFQMLSAQHIGVRELKNKLPEVLHSHKAVIATQHGKPAYFLLPYEDMLEIVEMLEEIKDKELLRLIESGRRSYAKSGWKPVSNLWKKLGI